MMGKSMMGKSMMGKSIAAFAAIGVGAVGLIAMAFALPVFPGDIWFAGAAGYAIAAGMGWIAWGGRRDA